MPPRASIFLEEARILSHEALPGAQFVLRLQAPQTAARAEPGSFVHLRCDPLLPLRRPLSIMRAAGVAGWIEVLYRAGGSGTRLLAGRRAGEHLSLLGPIGTPFTVHAERTRPLLIGGGIGIPPMIFLADRLRTRHGAHAPLLLMGSETAFPFAPRPSQIMVPGLPADVIAALPLIDDWGIPSRLASRAGRAGCYEGVVTELAALWLRGLDRAQLATVEIFACGPHPMLEAAARLARAHGLPCQVALEEFMACGVGGCAGCAVLVRTPDGPRMKRVCVDGPVFEAAAVFDLDAVPEGPRYN